MTQWTLQQSYCTFSAPLQRLAGRGFCSDRARNAPVNVPAVDGFDLHDPVRFLLNSTTNGRSGASTSPDRSVGGRFFERLVRGCLFQQFSGPRKTLFFATNARWGSEIEEGALQCGTLPIRRPIGESGSNAQGVRLLQTEPSDCVTAAVVIGPKQSQTAAAEAR
jgi:hypothetical protein